MKKLGLLVLFLGLLQMFAGGAASAHPFSVSYSTMTINADSVELDFSIDTISVIECLAVEVDMNTNGKLEKEEVESGKDAIARWMLESEVIKVDGEVRQGSMLDVRMEEKSSTLVATGSLLYKVHTAGKTVSLDDTLYRSGNSLTGYVHLLTVHQGDVVSEEVLKGESRHYETAVPADEGAPGQAQDTSFIPWHAITQFFLLGTEHILTGYDHLLFLTVLLLRKQTLKQYISIITAFTIAHSVTLTLAMLEVIKLPPQWVDLAVALSIVYVAAENLWRKEIKNRWMLTFSFGLIHGLGFATVLTGMDIPEYHLAWALVSFNLGIEAIQLTLLLIGLPLLIRWQKTGNFRMGMQLGTSIVILLAGYWALHRFWHILH